VLSPARGEGVEVCLRGIPEVVVRAAVGEIIQRVKVFPPAGVGGLVVRDVRRDSMAEFVVRAAVGQIF
jgi:hypothetical protein